MARNVRSPAVAGQFYEADPQVLAHQIEGCFTSPRGPGQLPPHHRSDSRRIRAAVVPHAGYPYSGPIAAHAYYAIGAEREPATVLILGVDHFGHGVPFSLSNQPWETPLGPVEVDHELAEALHRGPIEIDEPTHAAEHSIEVQLPFLQYVLARPRFVALMIRYSPYAELQRIAEIVRKAIDGRDVLLLASTDFSHYISAADADRLDHLAINEILRRDAHGLYRVVDKNAISMCGIAPTTVLLAAVTGEDLAARLLRWGHSGEEAPMREVVGYGSLLLEAPGPSTMAKTVPPTAASTTDLSFDNDPRSFVR